MLGEAHRTNSAEPPKLWFCYYSLFHSQSEVSLVIREHAGDEEIHTAKGATHTIPAITPGGVSALEMPPHTLSKQELWKAETKTNKTQKNVDLLYHILITTFSCFLKVGGLAKSKSSCFSYKIKMRLANRKATGLNAEIV